MKFDEIVEQEAPAPAKRGLELRRRPPVILAGGLPTVSLLPREFRAAARGRTIKRAFVAGVVVAVAVAASATAGATALSNAAQSRLDDSNATTQQLVGQLAKFREVQALQQGIAVGNAAVQVGTSTEIDWQAQIDAVESAMPAGWTVTSITADSASPVQSYTQGTSPIEMPRAATMLVSITTNDISSVGPWLRELRSTKAYADATASVLSDSSSYNIQLTLHLSPKAIVSAGKASK
jgi:hypothetical protein